MKRFEEPLGAFALNCTLKSSPQASSTERMLRLCLSMLEQDHDVSVPDSIPRVVDESIFHGVSSDEGEGDGWPQERRQILDADILLLGTPIWMGHTASPCQQVLERLDAFLAETAEDGRMIAYDRVALVAVVGNEDGAHHVGAEVIQALNDVGFAVPPVGMTYWVGEAMQKTDFIDLEKVPEVVENTAATMVANGVHLAQLLRDHPFPKQRF